MTLRENTERPETVDVGANVIAGYHRLSILESADTMMARKAAWDNSFGDGNAARRIIDASMDR